LELCMYHNGTPLNVFALQPDPARTRTQYLGADVLPATLGGIGYINTSAYPTFAPPPTTPSGTFSLTLRLTLDGNPVEERLLATFDRAPCRQCERLTPYGGELTYLRYDPNSDKLRASALDFGDALRLTGWSGPARVTSEAALAVELRWQALQPLDRSLFTE